MFILISKGNAKSSSSVTRTRYIALNLAKEHLVSPNRIGKVSPVDLLNTENITNRESNRYPFNSST